MRSLPLKRKTDDLNVYCSNKQQGCTAIVKLCELEAHLSQKIVNDGCGFVQVICINKCGASIMHKDMKKHLQQSCPKRIVSCPHCRALGAHDYVTVKHAEKCEEAPLNCPRGCKEGIGIKRKELDEHKEVCKLEPIKCPFFDAGCKEPLIRKDLNLHLEQSTNQHLLKIMTAHSSLRQTIDTAASQIAALQRVVKDKEVASALKPIGRNLRAPKHDLELVKEGDSLTFKIPRDQLKNWKSDPFYVVDYKMYIKIFPRGFLNYLSLVPTKGEHDDQLEWPMNLELNICIGVRGSEPFNDDLGVYAQAFMSCIQCNPIRVQLGRTREISSMRLPYNSIFTCHKSSAMDVEVKISAHHCKLSIATVTLD